MDNLIEVALMQMNIKGLCGWFKFLSNFTEKKIRFWVGKVTLSLHGDLIGQNFLKTPWPHIKELLISSCAPACR